MRKRDQNNTVNAQAADLSMRDPAPPPKSFLFDSTRNHRKAQPSEAPNKENGVYRKVESKEVFDQDWVKAFERKQSTSDDPRKAVLKSTNPAADIINRQFKFSYLDFGLKTKEPIKQQPREGTQSVIGSQEGIQPPRFNSQVEKRSFEPRQIEQPRFDGLNIYANLKHEGNRTVKSHSKHAAEKQETSSQSSLFQLINQIKQSQEVAPRCNQKDQPKKEETQPYYNPKPFSIPKSYLERNLGQRTHSEKSLQSTSSKNNRMQNSDQKRPPKTTAVFLYYISTVIQSFQSKEPTAFHDIAKDHIQQLVQGVKFALNVEPSEMHVPKKKLYLSKPSDRKTIIFDLDETLIHCNIDNLKASDVVLQVTFPNGENMEAAINIRPYAQYVLANLAKHFEIVVFTASHASYANKIIDYLDPQGTVISHRFFREHCLAINENLFVKDLRIFANRSLANILIVDNSAFSFAFQLENGVPILPYYNNKNDEQLRHLQSYLMQFKNVKDVRSLNSKLMKIPSFGQYHDAVDLIKTEFHEYIE